MELIDIKVKFICKMIEDDCRIELNDKYYLKIPVVDEWKELIEDHITEDMSTEDCVKFLLEEGYINM